MNDENCKLIFPFITEISNFIEVTFQNNWTYVSRNLRTVIYKYVK